ncbi:Branched-chain amino acid transport system 2 carrier protein [Chryseobacterium potabilaquae]|uniref:Branched-chain amino acid transport system 2 carrier protein n=2 Tax=Chryseobacterium potabilaquae TaxID=2675057 RepID=A0A6N4XCJ1_9FLAO|nr:Branched-chain amino acid transport system 2 carrier protein [Chryseobacterium potabilaquae]
MLLCVKIQQFNKILFFINLHSEIYFLAYHKRNPVMKNNNYTIITLGFALFAMFFGAGNLILPPFIGIKSGSEFFYAIIGFIITGIIFPLISLIAVVQIGHNFTDIGKRVNKKMITLLAFIIIWFIGPLIAIPRTGATTFEIGLQPIFPDISPIISAVLFFGITGFLAISPSKIVDIIGKYLTPVIILLLLILIIVGIVNVSHVLEISSLSPVDSFALGFHEGYQTMDVLGAVIFAGIIITTITEKGFTQVNQRVKMTTMAGLIAAFCLLIIYGGLVYLGATSGYPVTEDLSRSKLLLHISNSILGKSGTYIISLAIALACLTTAIALTSAFATFMEKITKGISSYKINVIFCCLLSAILSVKGVDEIINYAGILLGFVYPIVFTLIIYLIFFEKIIKSKAPYVAAVITSALVSSLSIFQHYGIAESFMTSLKDSLPLVKHSLEWVLPSFLAFTITSFFSKKRA